MNSTASPLQERQHQALRTARRRLEELAARLNQPIAIVGMACRVPGASSVEGLWQLLSEGRDAVSTVPADRWSCEEYYAPEPGTPYKTNSRQAGYLPDVRRFDARFFGISPREAQQMDPQQRLLLEVSYEALEHSLLPATMLRGEPVGVFVGISSSEYAVMTFGASRRASQDAYSITGTSMNGAAGRLAYFYGFNGPALAIDTACSSSLVAIYQAARSLIAGECHTALAAGVNCLLTPQPSIALAQNRVLSPSGRCSPFSMQADGLVRAEGCGVVVLKRLSDAVAAGCRILAVIRSGHVNQDGSSSGLTVPNGHAQRSLIQQAVRNANLAAHDIQYVEAHGTATSLGDPIELNALGQALCVREARQSPLLIGSVKANLGHLEAASGIAGVLKVVLAFQHRMLPAQIHAHPLTRAVDWQALGLEVVTKPTPLAAAPGTPVYAGVSSFGLSGTNAHLILQDPYSAVSRYTRPSRDRLLTARPNLERAEFLGLSAKEPDALRTLLDRYHELLGREPDWRTLCNLTNAGRAHYRYRIGFVARDAQSLREQLQRARYKEIPASPAIPPDTLWVFTGRNQPCPTIDSELLTSHPVLAASVDEARQALTTHLGYSPLQEPQSPAALFCVQYGFSQLLLSFGIQPQCVVGWDLGEYAAAVAVGVMTLHDAARLVAHYCVPQDIASDTANALEEHQQRVTRISLLPARVPFFSAAHARVVTGEISQVRYWLEPHMTSPNVERVAQVLLDAVPSIAPTAIAGIEIGGHERLLTVLRERSRVQPLEWLPTLRPRDSLTHLMLCLQWLYEHGLPLRWPQATADAAATLTVELPTYPFAGESFWLPDFLTQRDPQGSLRYQLLWQPASESLSEGSLAAHAVVFAANTAFAQELSAALAHAGCCAKVHPIATLLSAQQLADTVPLPQAQSEIFYWLKGVEATADSIETALYAFVRLIRHYRSALLENKVRLHCLVDSRARSYSLVGAAIAGVCRCLRHEDPGLQLTLLGIDADASRSWQINTAIREVRHALATSASREEIMITAAGRLRRRLIACETLPSATSPVVRPDRTYLITGGTGAVGRLFAQVLVDLGAREVILLSRGITPGADAEALTSTAQAHGARLTLLRADVADYEEMRALLTQLPLSHPPLGGIIHAAGVIQDCALWRLTERELHDVLAPKVNGALILDQLTRGQPLDFFVLVSSIAAVLGGAGQSNYAAANACLDALACERRSLGLAACSLALGPVAGAGLAAAPSITNRLHNVGLKGLSLERLREQLPWLLAAAPPHAVLADFDWQRLRTKYSAVEYPVLESFLPAAAAQPAAGDPSLALPVSANASDVGDTLRQCVARVLRLSDSQPVRDSETLQSLGFDSVTLLELRDKLTRALGCDLPVHALFDHPQIGKLTRYLTERVEPAESSGASPALPVAAAATAQTSGIAIIGMACRFPGGIRTPEELWRALLDGRDLIGEIDSLRWDARSLVQGQHLATTRAGVLEDVDCFDGELFGITPREARSMDPQQRLVLEVSWEALERAGYDFASSDVPGGVFIGPGPNEYARRFDTTPSALNHHLSTGNALSVTAGRVAFLLDWQGPALAVDTACSSSLMAVHLAVNALKGHEIDLALAGGVNLLLSAETSILLSKSGMLARDGRCKTFDAAADGYVRSEGCGILVLKRLSDALAAGDEILAVIRGSAASQDGRSQGLTAPNGEAQRAVLRRALAVSNLEPHQIGFLEAHGTGTPLGDPIEMAAIQDVYGTPETRQAPLYVSSIKTNIGHAEAAAGIAGLIKAVLCLRERQIVPHLHFKTLNSEIRLDSRLIAIPTRAAAWESLEKRRAAVSSFGFSGTNVHMILEEAPATQALAADGRGQASTPLRICAASREALIAFLRAYQQILSTLDPLQYHSLCQQSWRRARLTLILLVDQPTAAAALLDIERYLADPALLEDSASLQTGKEHPSPGRGLPYRHLAPTYPFGRSRFWLEPRTAPRHSRLGLRLGNSSSARVTYAVDYAREPPYRLEEHVIHGRVVVPAAAHLALILGMLRELLGSGSVELQDVLCEEALVVEAATEPVRYELIRDAEPGTAGYHITVSSSRGGREIQHLRAYARTANHERAALRSAVARQELARPGVLATIPGKRFYDELYDPAVTLGGTFRAVIELEQHVGHCNARILLPALSGGLIPAGSLDACLQTIALATLADEPGTTHMSAATIPVAIERLIATVPVHTESIEDSLQSALCTAQLIKEDRPRGLFVHDLTLQDSSGQPLLQIQGLLSKAISAAQLAATLSSTEDYLVQEWVPDPAESATAFAKAPEHGAEPAGSFLLLNSDDSPGCRELRELLERSGSSWSSVNDTATIEAEAAAMPGDLHVLYWLPRSGEADWASACWQQGRPLLECMRKWAAFAGLRSGARRRRIALTVMTDTQADLTADEMPSPLQGWVCGLCKSLALELTDLIVTWLDVDVPSLQGARHDALEHWLSHTGEPWLAYRRGRRYVLRVTPQSLPAPSLRKESVRGDGIYLITGGLGDLAVATARWLIQRGVRRLALLGRRELDAALRARLSELRNSIVSADVTIDYHSADVADYGALAQVFDKLSVEAPIRGIVHTAGVLVDGTFDTLTDADFTAVNRPKVTGSWNLHLLSATQPVECFLLYSSLAALLGAAGQSNYAAANGFMDALARYRHRQGLPALSVNWGAWEGIGMASRTRSTSRTNAFSTLPPERALELLDAALNSPRPQIAIVAADSTLLRQQWQHGREAPSLLRDWLRLPAGQPQTGHGGVLEEVLRAPRGARLTLIVDHLKRLARAIMGVPAEYPFPDDKPFQELGFDSLMSVELKKAIQQSFRIEVPATLIFDYPGIDTLAEAIDQRLPGQRAATVGTPPAPATAVALEMLDEHELAGMLEKML